MNRQTAPVMLLAALALCACSGTARLVREDTSYGAPVGGRIELHGAYMTAMADAQALMTERCDGRYTMTEHDDMVVFSCGGADKAE